MNAISAVVYREAKIRATNFTFIFWDLFFPLLYMLVFGVGINTALGAPTGLGNVNYNEFFLGGILAMASFAIASNTSWSFFLDRDNGIFYEMLTYPMSRSEYLLGKVIFNVLILHRSGRSHSCGRPSRSGHPRPVDETAPAPDGHGNWHGRMVFSFMPYSPCASGAMTSSTASPAFFISFLCLPVRCFIRSSHSSSQNRMEIADSDEV